MQLPTPEDLGLLVREARRKHRLSQSDLAGRAGVSRQWLSMVENGKTTVEFDLVFRVLGALGYSIHIERHDRPASSPASPVAPVTSTVDRSARTRLTRRGRPLNPGAGWTE